MLVKRRAQPLVRRSVKHKRPVVPLPVKQSVATALQKRKQVVVVRKILKGKVERPRQQKLNLVPNWRPVPLNVTKRSHQQVSLPLRR